MNLFEGDLQPGNSPGISSFAGDVAFSYSSTVAIEIGGTSAGQDYDLVKIARRAILDGTLEVTLVDDFLPVAGQSFEIMSYGVHSGEFFTENLPALPGGLDWIVNYNSRSLELMVVSAVPEPSSFILFAVGLAILATPACVVGHRVLGMTI